ncbi:MAG: hypothetical protein M3272_02975 [Actinomycetota bacterium]|nr:hypothetical protein [Actinomycetota bacterium]
MLGERETRWIFTGFLLGMVLSIAFGVIAWTLTGSPHALIAAMVAAVASAAGMGIVVLGIWLFRRRRRQ